MPWSKAGRLSTLSLALLGLFASSAFADEIEGHYRMGLNYERRGDFVAAAREVHEAVRLRPGYAAAWLTLGGIERKQGHMDAALEAFEKVIALSPKEQQGYALAGAVLIRLKKYEQAADRLRKAIEFDKDDLQSIANLGLVLRKLNKNEEAVKVMDDAVKRKPDDPDLLNNLAVALRQLRRYEEAIAHLQHALELKPADVEAAPQHGDHAARGGALEGRDPALPGRVGQGSQRRRDALRPGELLREARQQSRGRLDLQALRRCDQGQGPGGGGARAGPDQGPRPRARAQTATLAAHRLGARKPAAANCRTAAFCRQKAA